jgi:hypothetical protein
MYALGASALVAAGREATLAPSPTPTPTDTPSGNPSSTPSAQLAIDPTSGPRDTVITVTGQGWEPGAQVVVQFMNSFGGQPGATAQAVTDAEGTFTTTIAAHDSNPNPLPGPHTVTADDSTHHAEATFTVTN